MNSKILNRDGLYNTRIGRYYPTFYKNLLETDELIKTENQTMDWLFTIIEQAQLNQYIAYANEIGISAYEQLFKVASHPDIETLEERRLRLLNRIQSLAYFTMNYLRNKLDSILGVGNYEIEVDYANYTLYVKSSTKNAFMYGEVASLIGRIKPANIVYISVPLISQTLGVTEEIYAQKWGWNYIPTRWIVGKKPIISIQDSQKIKGKGVSSMTEDLLDKLRDHIAQITTKVKINNYYEITEFVQKSDDLGYLRIQFKVNNWEQIKVITNLKLISNDGKILTNDAIYLPLESDSMVEYRINIKELLENE